MQEERFVSGNAEQSYSGFKIKKNTNRALQSILIVVKHESGSRQIAVVKIAVLIVICIESNLAELEWDTGVLS